MASNDEECKGCLSYKNFGYDKCTMRYKDNAGVKCPCLDCLVKSVCDQCWSCFLFSEYVISEFDFRK